MRSIELGIPKHSRSAPLRSVSIIEFIARTLGRFDLIANPILDTDFNGLGKLDFAPAVRAAYKLSEQLAFAIEHYADFGPIERFSRASAQSQTLFAVLDYGSSSNGVEFGIGRGLTRASDSCVLKLMLRHDL